MIAERPPASWRLPVVILLFFTAPPLALAAWILLSGDQRKVYWQSWCVKGGLAVVVIGSVPLLAVIVAAKIGLWPDPDPNPVGLGVLFLLSVLIGSLSALVGVVWTHLEERKG